MMVRICAAMKKPPTPTAISTSSINTICLVGNANCFVGVSLRLMLVPGRFSFRDSTIQLRRNQAYMRPTLTQNAIYTG